MSSLVRYTFLSTNGTRFLIYELGQNMKWISALAHTRWSTGLISSLISLPMRRRDLKNMDIAFHQIDKSEILHSNNIFKTINISFINSLERKWKYEYIIIFLFVLVVHNYYESSHFCCKHVPTKRFHQVHRPIYKKRNDIEYLKENFGSFLLDLESRCIESSAKKNFELKIYLHSIFPEQKTVLNFVIFERKHSQMEMEQQIFQPVIFKYFDFYVGVNTLLQFHQFKAKIYVFVLSNQ